ncbi:MAG: hypothetical protein F4X76_09695, partial [Chloroflexi bacterium]|nr:hypothetical protein [Chloroflexota bacterium]
MAAGPERRRLRGDPVRTGAGAHARCRTAAAHLLGTQRLLAVGLLEPALRPRGRGGADRVRSRRAGPPRARRAATAARRRARADPAHRADRAGSRLGPHRRLLVGRPRVQRDLAGRPLADSRRRSARRAGQGRRPGGRAVSVTPPTELRDALEDAVRAAGEAISAIVAGGRVRVGMKWGEGPVTEADHAADEVLHERLMPLIEGAHWLSEESEQSAPIVPGEPTWVVDPLDGTREFLLGLPEFGVSVGLFREDRLALGAVALPPPAGGGGGGGGWGRRGGGGGGGRRGGGGGGAGGARPGGG